MTLYALYGLAVASEFDCPEISEITPEQAAARNYDTIYVKRAQGRLELPEARQHESWMWATRDAALYEIPDIARFLVERPDRITVEMLPGAVESDMRAFLLGVGIATLLHMRGLIPLHISAIQTPDGVVAFTGPSGAGKSTRVAALHFKHGWPVICDDVAVLHPSDERPLLHAGMNRIKLWRDAVERFNVDPSRLTRDVMRMDKFHLHAPEMFVNGPVELEKLVEIGGEAKAEGSGAATFEMCMNAIYRPELAALFADKHAIFSAISRVAPLIRTAQEPRLSE
ncbi:MAG: hypothetical protein ACXIT4_11025 [Erythrobacter sp.]